MTTADRCLWALKLLALLGSALMAGTFFAFSSFVMAALSRLAPAQGLAAMQSINIRVLNPIFLGVFMGTALACAALALSALLRLQQPGSHLLLLACLLYLVGTFGVTAAFNVPLNDALAVVKPNAPDAAARWAAYASAWTLWNHVRTIAALAATALLALALRSESPR